MTVVGRTQLTILGHFVTLSVYLCIQHDAREAARRAGLRSSIHKVK